MLYQYVSSVLCIIYLSSLFFFLMIRRPPRSTRTDTLFPYTTLFRSRIDIACRVQCAAIACLPGQWRRRMTKRLPKWTFAVFPLVLASAAYGSTGANSTRSSNDPKMHRHPSPSLIGDRLTTTPIIMTMLHVGRNHIKHQGDGRHNSQSQQHRNKKRTQ